MGGGGGGGGGVLSATLFGCTGGVIILGISTNTRKMFRPAPAYFVSSLTFRTSVCSVGSSDCVAFCFPPALFLVVLTVGCGMGSGGAPLIFAGAAALDEPNPNIPTNRLTKRTTASTPSTTAAITLFRFSAPTFTTSSSDKFPLCSAASPFRSVRPQAA